MSVKNTAAKPESGFEKTYKNILKKNEIRANGILMTILLIISLTYLISQLFGGLGLFKADDYVSSVIFFVTTCFCFISIAVAARFDCEATVVKYLLVLSIEFIAFSVTLYSVYGYMIFFAIPLVASLVYSDILFTAVFSFITYGFFILYVAVAPYFGLSVNYFDISGINIPSGTVLTVGESLTDTLVEAGIINDRTIFANQISLIIVGSFALFAIAGISIVVTFHAAKMLKQSATDSEERLKDERRIDEANEKMMLSQLRPHFLYNCLTAIMAIDGNPPETVAAIGSFAKYLRTNLDSLECDDTIPFEKELEHIKRYLSLEKLRFDDRLETEFDIETTDFSVPPLSVQMAVENAVVHGVSKKPEGGKVTLKVTEENGSCVITVEDNGLGFDMKEYAIAPEGHVGIKNITSRVETLCGGTVNIDSAKGRGTKVTITVPKQTQE